MTTLNPRGKEADRVAEILSDYEAVVRGRGGSNVYEYARKIITALNQFLEEVEPKESESPTDSEIQKIAPYAPEVPCRREKFRVFRDAETGKFVTDEYAAVNPTTTVAMTQYRWIKVSE